MKIYFFTFLSQNVEGWYYLLPEEYGLKKHLQVIACRKQLLNKANTDIHTVNKDLRHMQAHTVSNLLFNIF